MGMSVGVTYSSATGEYCVYSEKRVNDLVDQLMRADLVVGFNVINFDYEVLLGYTILDLKEHIPTLDLMVELEAKLGHRLALDCIAQATLGVGKTGDGLEAIRWWREGRRPRYRGVLLLRREGDEAGARVRRAAQATALHRPVPTETIGGGRVGLKRSRGLPMPRGQMLRAGVEHV